MNRGDNIYRDFKKFPYKRLLKKLSCPRIRRKVSEWLNSWLNARKERGDVSDQLWQQRETCGDLCLDLCAFQHIYKLSGKGSSGELMLSDQRWDLSVENCRRSLKSSVTGQEHQKTKFQGRLTYNRERNNSNFSFKNWDSWADHSCSGSGLWGYDRQL